MKLPKIERGIPIPPVERKQGTGITIILRNLKVGNSFLWKRDTQNNNRSLYTLATRVGIRVSVRAISKTKTRVWRVA